MAFAARSVKLVIANEFRVGWPRWPAPAAASGVGLEMRPHSSAVLFQSSAILLIYLTDAASGQSVVLGAVKQSVPGALIPPNQVLYRSAFDGVEADVLYIWKHNAFSQNIILKENPPPLPPGLDPATTRLEILTELVQAPDVQITSQVLRKEGNIDVVDHGLISFGEMFAVPGTAFPVDGGSSLNLTGPYTAPGNAIPVFKRWQTLEDGRKFVIESVRWQQIEPALRDLRA